MMVKHAEHLVMHPGFEEFMSRVDDLARYELDYLADAVHVRRLQIMSKELAGYGIASRSTGGPEQEHQFYYLCVYAPEGVELEAGEAPAEWADLEECRRLVDTLRNLPPAEAYARWRKKVAPLVSDPYTEAEARQDIRRERADLKRQYEEAGEISGEDYKLAWEQARDLLESVEEMPQDLITQAEAAALAGISIQGINQAIRTNRLRGYKNPHSQTQRQGATLVSEAAVRRVWDAG